ncbi:MAG: flagellar basal body P-ring formation chaperone FlgA [Sulfuriferula sp.]
MKIVLLILWLLPTLCFADAAAPKQDRASILHSAEKFLQVQTAGLPGQVKINVGALDEHVNLAACDSMHAFIPAGGRIWGKTTIGVRCTSPSPWTVYLQANISVIGNYIVSAAPLAQGQIVNANQLDVVSGDLTQLPNSIITDSSQAVGRIMAFSLPAGTPLRTDALRTQIAIQQGQNVKLISRGNGFQVSSEGRAIAAAMAGHIVQVRVASGQIISGIAQADGIVNVSN